MPGSKPGHDDLVCSDLVSALRRVDQHQLGIFQRGDRQLRFVTGSRRPSRALTRTPLTSMLPAAGTR